MKSAMKKNAVIGRPMNVTSRKKRVRFSPHIVSRDVMSRHDYTPMEWINTWYKKRDLIEIRKSVSIIAKRMELERNQMKQHQANKSNKKSKTNSGFFGMLRPKPSAAASSVLATAPLPFQSPYKTSSTEIQRSSTTRNNKEEPCYRGLEIYTTRGRERVESIRKQACAAVMREQMYQQLTTQPTIDFDAIAFAYKEVTWPCRVAAHKVGNMDATWVLRNRCNKKSVPMTRKQQYQAKHPKSQKSSQHPNPMRPPISPIRAGGKPKAMQMTSPTSPVPKKRTAPAISPKTPKKGSLPFSPMPKKSPVVSGVGAPPLTSPPISPKRKAKVTKSTIIKETKITTTSHTSPSKLSTKSITSISTSHIRDGYNHNDKLLESPRRRPKSPIRKQRQLAGRAA